MKIGIMSDLHLGYRQYGLVEREKDFYKQLKKCCSQLNELEVDIVIIAGDIFDKPNPSPEALHEYSEAIGNLEADIVVALQGNHTMLMKKDHYSVDKFFCDDGGIEGYYLLDDESMNTHNHGFNSDYDLEYSKWMNSECIIMDGITYRPDSQLSDFLEKQKELADLVREKKIGFKILITHQAYQEFCGFTGVELSINDLDTKPYDLIINGHIHSHEFSVLSEGTLFLQPGSIERMNTVEAFDEAENGKGVWVLDLESNNLDFFKVESDRKFYQGEVNFNSEDDIKEWFSQFKHKYDVKPILSYNYHDFIGKPYLIRDAMVDISKYVLFDNSNIYDETEEDIVLEIEDGEIPTIAEAFGLLNIDLDDDARKLAIDIHNSFNEGRDDISKLLEDFREKHFNHKPKGIDIEKIKEEIDGYERYFESL